MFAASNSLAGSSSASPPLFTAPRWRDDFFCRFFDPVALLKKEDAIYRPRTWPALLTQPWHHSQ